MAQQVFPTKSNLMATKRSLALAEQGYDLMDRKRNILVREMMQLIDRAAGIQDRISAAYAEAYDALQKANIMLGSVGEYAGGVPVECGLRLSTRSVMGVELPTLSLQTTSPLGIYYDLESTNGTLDVAYLKFNEVKTLTVELTEVETSVIRPGQRPDPPDAKDHQVHRRGAGRARTRRIQPPESHQGPKRKTG